MAISVKEIQEKEFATQAMGGYNVEQVDDFLDALAEQMGAMSRENLALTASAKQSAEALAKAQQEKAELEKKLPDYNENGYFKNLESAMRESLVGAQRIADETVNEANKKAQQTIEDANLRADKIVEDASVNAKMVTERAEKSVAELNAEGERLRAQISAYRENFKKLLDEQFAALKNSEALLK